MKLHYDKGLDGSVVLLVLKGDDDKEIARFESPDYHGDARALSLSNFTSPVDAIADLILALQEDDFDELHEDDFFNDDCPTD
jgi:hypothetical protein